MENTYEGQYVSYSMSREYCEVTPSKVPETAPAKKNRVISWKAIFVTGAVLVVVGLLVVILIFATQQENQENSKCACSRNTSTTCSTAAPLPKDIAGSCLELKNRSVIESGLKTIRLIDDDFNTQIYCDMETDGGGWTLVASIHESDISAKCFSDDRWSGLLRSDSSSIGKTNWENEMIFGHVHASFDEDYKSTAYYKLQASDLMVWHVPRESNFDTARSSAKLRYRTTNQFFQKYGGNLKNLFTQHFPMTTMSDDTLDLLVESFTEVRGLVSDWYNYAMSTGSDRIYDGKLYSDMGSQIRIDGDKWRNMFMNYGSRYRQYHSEYTSSTAAPLTALVSVMNEDRSASYYDLRVYTRSSTSGDNVTDFEGNVALGDFRLYYHAREFYNFAEEYATECRFHFYISNTKAWKSIPPSRFYLSYLYIYNNYYKTVEYRIAGRPSRILFGYMLLAKQTGSRFTTADLTDVAELILKKVARSPIFESRSAKHTLVVPVTFDKGNSDAVEKMIPPKMRSSVQAGNIQFRAFNHTGYPNAFCPGISVNSSTPEHVCVGGLSDDITTYGTCGDFAGWSGQSRDTASAVNAVGYAHSFEDILSTLMIFYR